MNLDKHSLSRIEKLIGSVRWQKARHWPLYIIFSPHEYTVFKWRPDLQEEFEFFVKEIRGKGYVRLYGKGKKPYINLDIGAYRYWTMGSSLDETELINRVKLSWKPVGARIARGKEWEKWLDNNRDANLPTRPDRL